MYTRNKFLFKENRKIDKTLAVMKRLAEKDNYFAIAIEQFNSARGEEKYNMCKYLLEIFDSTQDGVMNLETAVILSAYEL